MSTHPLMLRSACSKEAFLVCPPLPFWNLSSFTVESTLSTPCSRSDPPLSRQSSALALHSPPVLLDYNGHQDICFSRGTSRPMSWPDVVRYLRPPQSVVVSLLLLLVPTLVLSRTGGVLSHRSILPHRFSRFPPRNLCSLVTLAVSSLVFAATDTAFF